jgi:hypothetical protein
LIGERAARTLTLAALCAIYGIVAILIGWAYIGGLAADAVWQRLALLPQG